MSNEQTRPDMRHLWQGQVVENTPLSLDELRSRISKMNRTILTRTFVAALGCVIFTVFSVLLFRVRTHLSATDLRLLECFFFVCAGYCLWWLISLLRRTRSISLTEGEPDACAAFYRSELRRQRNSYRRSAVWVPLAFSSVWIWALLAMHQFRVVMIVIWLLFVPFWVYQNLELARSSQRELDELKASSGQ